MSEENHCGDELNQAAMDESPAQAPTATQVWPAPPKVQFSKLGVGYKRNLLHLGLGNFQGLGTRLLVGLLTVFYYYYWCRLLACCDCLCFEQHLS